VVVAGGPLSSTKLLLDSACPDFPQGLGNTEGLLGRYLHDHVLDMCFVHLDRPRSRFDQSAYLTRASYKESEPLLAASCTIGNGTSRLDKILTFTPIKAQQFGIVIFGTMVPTPENYVRSHPCAKDEFGYPLLDLHITFDEAALRTTRRARERLVSILEAAGHRCTVPWTLPEITPGVSVHYGGTVRMHESARYGMVDAWNRLHAAPNVVVSDASCFTTGVEKNPTLTAMALSARAARRLSADLRSA
jgi:choline dehydrogenase-like flavoprotein